jgi:hypothetical protein
VVYDRSGWLTVRGPRFGVFLPLGSRVSLEHDILFLMEAYQQPYESIMAMPSSRRHRLVKMKEEITRQQRAGEKGGQVISGGGAPNGLAPAPGGVPTPAGRTGVRSPPVRVGYSTP